MKECKITFQVNGIDKEINVIHDLPETKGLSIEDAFTCWSARTKEFTSKSFVHYLLYKGFTAIVNPNQPCAT